MFSYDSITNLLGSLVTLIVEYVKINMTFLYSFMPTHGIFKAFRYGTC